MLDMTISMLKRTITKYNKHAGNDIETRSLTSYHSTRTATPAGYRSMSEHHRIAIAQNNDYDQLNRIEEMLEIAPKDSSESAQWMAKSKRVADRVAKRKVAYSTSIRDQIMSRSTTDDNPRGGGLFSIPPPYGYEHQGARPRNTVAADHMSILNDSVPELVERGNTDSSIAAPTMGPTSYTSCIAHTTPTGFGNVPEVMVTNPSESGSREPEELQRRLDTLRSTGQNPGDEMQEDGHSEENKSRSRTSSTSNSKKKAHKDNVRLIAKR
jgi:hypothetical protein